MDIGLRAGALGPNAKV